MVSYWNAVEVARPWHGCGLRFPSFGRDSGFGNEQLSRHADNTPSVVKMARVKQKNTLPANE